ncbi:MULTISPECIES: hypothetical protein [Paraburkholderia]|uniref:Uncharacterized protein n=2 Tax=Paraburkholderia TaxID=1822464 RepID=A0A7Y9WUK3_9BURK|nr:hypothetical protein [Paraburkholderia bryophila]NYH26386.1 hypothetical protein [Paraburkholderia bryophila]
MFSFLLIGSLSRQLDARTLVENLGIVQREQGERYIAFGPTGMQDGWIAVQALQDAEKDFEPDELDKVRKFIGDPWFLLVEGRDGKARFSDNFVLGIEHPETLVIDNDHGLIDRADTVQNMIRDGRVWLEVSS